MRNKHRFWHGWQHVLMGRMLNGVEPLGGKGGG